MQTFVMKGHKDGKRVYGSFSSTPLEMKGHFKMQGPQVVGDGGTPQWVADLLESHPDIDHIAISSKKGGIVWSRMPESDDA